MKKLSLVAMQHAKKSLKNKSSQSLFTKFDLVFDSSFLKVLVVLITMLLSGVSDMKAQRVRYSYEWPCYDTPSLTPLDPTPPPLTLCLKNPFKGTPITVGKGTAFPTSADLIKVYSQTINSKEILVSDNFVINESIIFRACKVKVNPDKAIIVNADRQLYSMGSKFFVVMPCGMVFILMMMLVSI